MRGADDGPAGGVCIVDGAAEDVGAPSIVREESDQALGPRLGVVGGREQVLPQVRPHLLELGPVGAQQRDPHGEGPVDDAAGRRVALRVGQRDHPGGGVDVGQLVLADEARHHHQALEDARAVREPAQPVQVAAVVPVIPADLADDGQAGLGALGDHARQGADQDVDVLLDVDEAEEEDDLGLLVEPQERPPGGRIPAHGRVRAVGDHVHPALVEALTGQDLPAPLAVHDEGVRGLAQRTMELRGEGSALEQAAPPGEHRMQRHHHPHAPLAQASTRLDHGPARAQDVGGVLKVGHLRLAARDGVDHRLGPRVLSSERRCAGHPVCAGLAPFFGHHEEVETCRVVARHAGDQLAGIGGDAACARRPRGDQGDPHRSFTISPTPKAW